MTFVAVHPFFEALRCNYGDQSLVKANLLLLQCNVIIHPSPSAWDDLGPGAIRSESKHAFVCMALHHLQLTAGTNCHVLIGDIPSCTGMYTERMP